MVAFGFILLLIGVAGGGWFAWMALQSEAGVTLGVTGLQVTVLPITLFAAGAVSIVLVWLGVRFVAVGARHRSARRREMRELRSATPTGAPGASSAGVAGTSRPTGSSGPVDGAR